MGGKARRRMLAKHMLACRILCRLQDRYYDTAVDRRGSLDDF